MLYGDEKRSSYSKKKSIFPGLKQTGPDGETLVEKNKIENTNKAINPWGSTAVGIAPPSFFRHSIFKTSSGLSMFSIKGARAGEFSGLFSRHFSLFGLLTSELGHYGDFVTYAHDQHTHSYVTPRLSSR
jgi:hypothetical protein